MAVTANPGPPEDAAGGEGADDERLPCGRLLSEVWEQWDTGGTDAHTAGCEYCAAALGDLELLGVAVQRARDTEGAEPESGAGAFTLVERVMDVVRLELRPGRTLPLGEPDEDAWIVEAAAARTFRAAAELVPGVQVGSCRIAPLDLEAPAAGTGTGTGTGTRTAPRGPVRVRIEASVALTWNLQEAADEIRQRIAAAADSALGMEVASIDVNITDVTDVTDGFNGATGGVR
ncbi:Asp23/Gls24 family envelope stress response protein [Streptomyces sp. SID10853]|uniref:Asp23/Gls24 family envelope stress response protein n=1 Tax=Streptomyces sp. SID10853 TaxID=2706028 RepID=UPI0013C17D8F|nr:Asp23/Gls24 family envelope stress response protein [Streptomyces sp. SID10853]NDZ82161.1 Asp23/Gls24 family envelope stress response protein [Streptomyces sp. SID10853]